MQAALSLLLLPPLNPNLINPRQQPGLRELKCAACHHTSPRASRKQPWSQIIIIISKYDATPSVPCLYIATTALTLLYIRIYVCMCTLHIAAVRKQHFVASVFTRHLSC